MSIDYARKYILDSFQFSKIDPPDKEKAGDTFEALTGIYLTHQLNGVDGAKTAWEALRRMRPDIRLEKLPKLIHADDLKNLPSPAYIPGGYPLYSKGFNLLIGESGVGKSFVALDIAGRLAAEEVVVYIAGEGVHGYGARWECWKDFHQLKNSPKLYFWTEALQVMDDSALWDFFKELQDRKKTPSLIIIDTLARSAVGADENSAQSMGQFIASVDKIRNGLDCAVIVVHHTGKSGDIRGSTSLFGAADSVLAMSRNNGLIRVTNKDDFKGKNKYSKAEFDNYYTITDHSVGAFDGGVIVPAEKIESSENESEKLPSKREVQKLELQLTILALISDEKFGLPASLIKDHIQKSRTATHRYLSEMEKDGLVKNKLGHYTITEQGKEKLENNRE